MYLLTFSILRSLPPVAGVWLFLTSFAADAQPTADTLPPLAVLQARIDRISVDSTKIDQYAKVGGKLVDAYRDNDASALTERGLALAQQMGSKRDVSFFQSRLGDINMFASRYAEAIRLYQQSFDAATSIRDTNRMVFALLRLGQTYENADELTLAERYLVRTLQLARQSQSKQLADCYNSLSILEGKRKNYQKSVAYGDQCMAIEKKSNNLEAYHTALLNNAISYKNLKQYARAVAAYQEVLTYSQRVGKGYHTIMVYANIPWALLPLNRLDEAERYAQLTIEQATNGSADNRNELLEEAYKALTQVNRQRVNYRAALEYREKAITYHDSLFNTAKSQQLLELTTRYETEKKEAQIKKLDAENEYKQFQLLTVSGGVVLLLVALGLVGGLYRRLRRVNHQLADNNQQLNQTLTELRSTQDQLIQHEKMASLGELTAGIAHEIQNPLNFVNNFSELSVELTNELKEELANQPPDTEYIQGIIRDLSGNQQKINYHGNRAASIVRSMLEHSRTSTDEKQPTALNNLADEYLRLAYHGLRAKDKSFNADLVTNFEPRLDVVNVIPQDIGRVLLNLYNNAFYAVHEKQKQQPTGYKPQVTVQTQVVNGQAEVRVKDNGTGIPPELLTKIFQPFFTTKPTGQGTGLGLSLSYDIITKAHGGTLEVETERGQYTEMIIRLPM